MIDETYFQLFKLVSKTTSKISGLAGKVFGLIHDVKKNVEK